MITRHELDEIVQIAAMFSGMQHETLTGLVGTGNGRVEILGGQNYDEVIGYLVHTLEEGWGFEAKAE